MIRRRTGVFGGSVRASWALGLTGAALAAAAFTPWSWLLNLLGRASWARLVVVLIGVACLVASFRLRPVYYYSPEMPSGRASPQPAGRARRQLCCWPSAGSGTWRRTPSGSSSTRPRSG